MTGVQTCALPICLDFWLCLLAEEMWEKRESECLDLIDWFDQFI